MSGKQLVRLAIALGVLLILWGAAALARRREAEPSGAEAFRLPPITRSAVDRVVLTKVSDSTVLVRKDTSNWTVNGNRAAPKSVADLLNALTDSSAGSELVAQRKASQAGLGVDSAGGTRAQVMGGGRVLADFFVGKRSSDFSGGYVRRTGQEPTYLVRGRLVDVLSRTGEEWRDHQIEAVPADSIRTVEVSRGGSRYSLQRSEKGWLLSTGGKADSARAQDLVAAYGAVDASGFATPAQADSARFARPDRRTRLLRKDGTPILTLLFDSTAAGFWVRPDTGKTIYKLESWTADRLAPAESGLRAKPAGKK